MNAVRTRVEGLGNVPNITCRAPISEKRRQRAPSDTVDRMRLSAPQGSPTAVRLPCRLPQTQSGPDAVLGPSGATYGVVGSGRAAAMQASVRPPRGRILCAVAWCCGSESSERLVGDGEPRGPGVTADSRVIERGGRVLSADKLHTARDAYVHIAYAGVECAHIQGLWLGFLVMAWRFRSARGAKESDCEVHC